MTPPHSHVQSAESTLILVAFSLCSLCPLASVPWPGCSLIHHQNMKSIVSPSGVGRGGRGRVPEADLVPGEGGRLPPDGESQDAGALVLVPTLTGADASHRCFWCSYTARRSPQKRSRHLCPSGPFHATLLLTWEPFTGSGDGRGRETKEGTSGAPSAWRGACWTGGDFYFPDQTNTTKTQFRDRVYSAESRILNTGSLVGGGEQLTVRPC